MELLLFVVSVLAVGAVERLPPFLRTCRISDPLRDECVKASFQGVLTAIRQKTPSTVELPDLDPFTLDTATFNYRYGNILRGAFTFSKVKTVGVSRGTIQNLKSHFKGDTAMVQAESFFTRLIGQGNHNSTVSYRGLSVPSNGRYRLDMMDVKAKWSAKGKVAQINGEGFMQVVQVNILLDIKDMKIYASGIFPDKNLNEVFNGLFNQYWRLIYKDLIKETRPQWEPILRQKLNRFFAQIPYRLLITPE